MIYPIIVFLLVIASIIGLLFALKMLFYSERNFAWFNKIRIQPRTLSLKETLVLDPKRRIVLVHHGERAYLILLGQSGEILLNGPFEPCIDACDNHGVSTQIDSFSTNIVR